ncbi:uncharacterized protein LOC130801152 isoform X2 [Amaranthus tricolor]|uniref:uncharacterized protein LOC130801152 isoform X2 n=1 Tax=Amaranthus tricolor TaxID=29722 RepID=UPI0025868E38|nr:uncharacterized protein LOC130801152 isoform X2 [Amaranthus tricolor]XP_057520909.1 uncharacterized protein LOC130801152 isoform X2 [Amaranthus tricolor]
MEAQIWTPKLASCSNNYNYCTGMAWYLVSVLLLLGRPASLEELVAKCLLFRISPEFIEFLCGIPNSPIYLTTNKFVVISMSVYSAFGEFFANSRPKIERRMSGGPRERILRKACDFEFRYFRKRKKLGEEIVTVVKKRAVLRSIDENKRESTSFSTTSRTLNNDYQGVDLQTGSRRALNSESFGRVLETVNLINVTDLFVTPSMVNSGYGLLEYQQNIDGDQEIGNKHKELELNPHDNLSVESTAATNAAEDLRHSQIPETNLLDLNEQLQVDNGGPEERVENILLSSWRDIYCSVDKYCQTKSKTIDETHTVKEKQINVLTTSQPLVSTGEAHTMKMEDTIAISTSHPLFSMGETYPLKMEQTNAVSTSQPLLSMGDTHTVKMEQRNAISTTQPLVSIGEAHTVKREQSNAISTIQLLDSMGETDTVKREQTNAISTSHPLDSIGDTHTVKKEQRNIKSTSLLVVSADSQTNAQIAQTKSLVPKNVTHAEQPRKHRTLSKSKQYSKVDIVHKERKERQHQIAVAVMDKPKHIARNGESIQERCDNGLKSSKDQRKTKFPEFDSYKVEEEEGSGGYGTVYRARRMTDGLTFAIKCPHANAHKQHVKNEHKMLERFGGRNFVIRYEGSLKCESSECFVLEHVEHDRPEVLKREIDMPQLQSYGFCMFRALVSLHKQGVYHRDIKPGNFLFSRKDHKGYLIDFNLARDMNQKHGTIETSQPSNVAAIQQYSSGHYKVISPNKRKKALGALESKSLKKKPVDKLKAYEDLGRCNPLTSQGAEGSGLTSAKDLSTRTPSVERLREPLPCKGRKALINIAQEAMQSPNHGAPKAPTSNRKRVAASPGITDRKLFHPTPTPLHSSGIAISGAGSLNSGAGSLNNRGGMKPNKDGPCAGTKGFRAPEVLLRSLHQGPKVDVWSAGVTFLYLISGRMPFNGDPEQNMKEIVKLRGNEELWEVAKIHNRESSFPVELLDIKFLQSMSIKDWYLTNTKRQDLLGVIPDSLFDLLEKCLTVNPRLRITAEQALNHEFFAPCKEALLKQRLSRHDQKQDSRSSSLPLLCEPVIPSKKKLTAPVN